jgi:hypothetical protein
MYYRFVFHLFFSILFILLTDVLRADETYTFKPDNPVTAVWLQTQLKPDTPRLILTTDVEEILKQKLMTNAVVRNYYDFLKKRADLYLTVDPLERKQTGKRLLSVSRQAIARISTLALLYRLDKDPGYLTRLEAEINTICGFKDWNPSHFLDVAEMAFAVSIGIDWCAPYLKKETVVEAKKALKEKSLLASIKDPPFGWITSEHNWNQVCHGGLSAAAIVLAQDEPELAAKILARTLNNVSYALQAYAPDGAFPEGPTYWMYATYYTTIMIAMFESAFHTDFNITRAPGFLPSARYSLLTVAPSGEFYNYFDAGEDAALSLEHVGLLTWFGQRDSSNTYYDPGLFLSALNKGAADDSRDDRFSAITCIWLALIPEKVSSEPLPECWIGRGPNPLAIIRSPENSASGFFLAAKGGRAGLNHGNMDAGSFIFELNGVRWSLDPGNQSYYALEQIMGDSLWRKRQTSRRWTLLTKNNFGHSTLSVNHQLHQVDGFVPLVASTCADPHFPAITFDLTALYFENLEKAERTFVKKDDRTLEVRDKIKINAATRSITWAMMTTAAVEVLPEGARLSEDHQELKLRVLSPEIFEMRIVDLDPPPLPYDKQIENLKRIEIQVKSSAFRNSQGGIIVELSGR